MKGNDVARSVHARFGRICRKEHRLHIRGDARFRALRFADEAAGQPKLLEQSDVSRSNMAYTERRNGGSVRHL